MIKRIIYIFVLIIYTFIIPYISHAEVQNYVYIAKVNDAENIDEYQRVLNSNVQRVELEIFSENNTSYIKRTEFYFPNNQFKKALSIGDLVIVETSSPIGENYDGQIKILTYYRENNIYLWIIIAFILFLVIMSFRSNTKYIYFLSILIISGIFVVFLFRISTYILLIGNVLLLTTLTFLYSYFVSYKHIMNSLLLSASVFFSQLLSFILVYMLSQFKLIGANVFSLFFPSIIDMREASIYVFSSILVFLHSIYLADRVILDAISLKKKNPNVTRNELIQYLMSDAAKVLSNIVLTIFGLAFALSIVILLISSTQTNVWWSINASPFVEFIGIFVFIILNILIYVPVISIVVGSVFGSLDRYKFTSEQIVKLIEN